MRRDQSSPSLFPAVLVVGCGGMVSTCRPTNRRQWEEGERCEQGSFAARGNEP